MVELTRDQVIRLFNIAGCDVPENPTSSDISGVLIEIEKKISPCDSIQAQNQDKFMNTASVLIVDDLELSVYQLSKLLSSCGYKTSIARSIEEAIDLYKKQSFQYVVADLFLPKPENGLNLIDEISNEPKTRIDATKVIVVSGTDDKKLVNECFLKGANEFISKAPDWHKKVLQHIGALEVQKYGQVSEVFTNVEDFEKKIVSITLSNFYKSEVMDMFKREVQILINTGFVNLILDLEKVKSLDSTGLNVIVSAYKSCLEKDGSFKLCGVNNAVNDALSYVFLNNLIPIFRDKDAALFDYRKEDSLKK